MKDNNTSEKRSRPPKQRSEQGEFCQPFPDQYKGRRDNSNNQNKKAKKMKAAIIILLGFSSIVVNRLGEASKNQMVFGTFTVWLITSLLTLLCTTTISNLYFEANNTEMERIGDEQTALNTELDNRKAVLLKPEGVMNNNATYKLAWGGKCSASDKFYLILLRLLGFLLEVMVLIAKLSFRKSFKAYRDEVVEEVSASQDKKHSNEDVDKVSFHERISPLR